MLASSTLHTEFIRTEAKHIEEQSSESRTEGHGANCGHSIWSGMNQGHKIPTDNPPSKTPTPPLFLCHSSYTFLDLCIQCHHAISKLHTTSGFELHNCNWSSAPWHPSSAASEACSFVAYELDSAYSGLEGAMLVLARLAIPPESVHLCSVSVRWTLCTSFSQLLFPQIRF